MDIPTNPVIELMQKVAREGESLPQVARRRIPWLRARVPQKDLLKLYAVLESKLIEATKNNKWSDAADDLSFDMQCIWQTLDTEHRRRGPYRPSHLKLLA
jgi:hypothetical protein